VRGASHLARGTPNQDAIGWSGGGDAPSLALAVSDGHGDERCFRSDAGSRIAVNVALAELEALRTAPTADGAESLKRRLVDGWRAGVLQDLKRRPFAPAERAVLPHAYSDADVFLTYGATMLGVRVGADFILYVQLGDGDIIRSADDGTTVRLFEKDPRLALNQTNSLSQAQASQLMRVRVDRATAWPALIAASTDGYANSFRTDDDFLKVGRDFRALVAERGLPAIAGDLAAILDQAQSAGSRDDTTLGLIVRSNGEPAPLAQAPYPQPAEPEAPPRRRPALALLAAAAVAIGAAFYAVPWARDRLAGARSDAAVALVKQRAYAGALAAADAALRLNPTDRAALDVRGDALLHLAAARTPPAGADLWAEVVRAYLVSIAREAAAAPPGEVSPNVATRLAAISIAEFGAASEPQALAAAKAAGSLDARWKTLATSVAAAGSRPSASQSAERLRSLVATFDATSPAIDTTGGTS
jgi:hypothetical protein